jgi:pilus assembly protein CpaE
MAITGMRQNQVLFICPNRAVMNEVMPLLAHRLTLATLQDVNVYPDRLRLRHVIESVAPTICFLDFSSISEAFAVLSELHALVPKIPVIALANAKDPDVILRCLREGASDFLVRPFTTDQLESCLGKIARTVPTNARNTSAGKVIAVIPAKGAAGASTLACNLAHQCKRLEASPVLLADMDPLTGTVPFILKLKSTYSFLDVLQRADSLEADLWKQMTTRSQGLDVLLSPETLVDPAVDVESAEPIVEFARGMYQTVVLDCGGVYHNWNLSLARGADQILLVTTNELASVRAVQRAMIYLDSHRVEMGKVQIVLDRYQKDVGLQREYWSAAFGNDVFHVIPADNDAVQKSLMDGKPIQNGTQIGKSLAAMAERLVERRDPGNKSGKGGLLSSLFR